LTPLVLSESVDQPLDKCRLLTIALLHDLPESAIGDLPTPVEVPFPPGAEQEAEKLVLSELLRTLPYAEEWHAWWRKSVDGTSGVWRCG
jgi:putative hydrolase of HD superfamily